MKLSDNKIIWAYWDGPVNKIGKQSQQSWKKYLPDWKVIVLNKTTVCGYNLKLPSNYEELNIALKADIIRLNLLYNYGGVWLDYTILLKQNFSWLIDFVDSQLPGNYYQPYIQFSGYGNLKSIPANWFIVCPEPGNINIKKQLDLLVENSESYPNHSDTYIYNDVKSCRSMRKKGRTMGGYFSMYQTVCYLHQTDGDFKKAIRLPGIKTHKNKFLTKYKNGGKDELKWYGICGCVVFILIVLICFVFKFYRY